MGIRNGDKSRFIEILVLAKRYLKEYGDVYSLTAIKPNIRLFISHIHFSDNWDPFEEGLLNVYGFLETPSYCGIGRKPDPIRRLIEVIQRIVYGDPKEIMQLLGVDSGRKINTAYFRSKDLYRNRPNTLPMDYSFKRGFKPDLERIQKVLEEGFPTEIKQEDGKLLLSYGALKSICVSITGKKLTVTTESAIGANDVVAMDTNKRFRNFLEKATGYNGKQRLQMAKKELAKGAD